METVLRYSDLFLEIPAKIIRLQRLEVLERANEHGEAMMELIIDDSEDYLMIHNLTHTTDIKIAANIDGELRIVFIGVIVHIAMQKSESTFRVELKLKSKSFLLDITKKRRSFQYDAGLIYDVIKQVVESDNHGEVTSPELSGLEQREAYIQYNETDWRFVRRIASKYGKMLLTDVKNQIPAFYIGTQIGDDHHELSKGYTLARESGEFLESALNFGNWTMQQKIFFHVKTMDNYEISDNVMFEDILFKVLAKKMILEKQIVVFEYTLVKMDGFKTDIFYNPDILGAAIKGKVIAVQYDRVKLHLEIDEEQNLDEAHYYKMQIPYTADGSTGLYIMPQLGDEMVLFFPENQLEEAYAKTAIRQDGATNIKTQDPDVKYLSTIDKKELMFRPNEWQATATNGFILLNMDEGAGIEFTSSADINISSNTELRIGGKKAGFRAKKDILLATKGASIAITPGTVEFSAKGGISGI